MSSLASANGPSVICWLPPATRMRLPWLLGYRPPASRRTPAFIISSLNRIISMMTFCSGYTPASESLVALISTRNFIVGLLLFYEGDERAPLGSTRSAKISPICNRLESWPYAYRVSLLSDLESQRVPRAAWDPLQG